MHFSVHEAREFAPGHSKSTWRPRWLDRVDEILSPRIGAIIFRFLATLIATASILIMGWALFKAKPKATISADSSEIAELQTSFDAPPNSNWFGANLPDWFAGLFGNGARGFMAAASRDMDHIDTDQGLESGWFSLKLTANPKQLVSNAGGVDLTGLTQMRDTRPANFDPPPQPSAPAAAPAPQPARAAQEARSRRPAREQAPDTPVAAADEPAPPPKAEPAAALPQPAKPATTGPALTTPPSPEEEKLRQAITAARGDYRLADAAILRFNAFAATRPEGIQLADYHRQMDEIAILKKTAARERSTFDVDVDTFESAGLDSLRATQIAQCLQDGGLARHALIARKAVWTQPAIAAYVAMVELPLAGKSDPKADEKAIASVHECLRPLTADGTIGLLIDGGSDDVRPMADKLAATEGVYVFPRD